MSTENKIRYISCIHCSCPPKIWWHIFCAYTGHVQWKLSTLLMEKFIWAGLPPSPSSIRRSNWFTLGLYMTDSIDAPPGEERHANDSRSKSPTLEVAKVASHFENTFSFEPACQYGCRVHVQEEKLQMRSLKVQSCVVTSESGCVGFCLAQTYCGHPQVVSSSPCDFLLSPELRQWIFGSLMEKIQMVVCWWPGCWPFVEVLHKRKWADMTFFS